MNKSVFVKKNISAMQVFKTLLVLLEDNYTSQQLVDKLNQKEKRPIFTNAVTNKYINTLRHGGFLVNKVDNKYQLVNLPFGLDLLQNEIERLEQLYYVVKKRMSTKNILIFTRFLSRLNRYSRKTIVELTAETEETIFEKFENAIKEKRKLRIDLKNKKTVFCIPIRIINEKKYSRFLVNEDGKEKIISNKTVADIKILEFTPAKDFQQNVVLFKVKGSLAKRYILREWENVIEKKDGEIIVSNRNEPKEILLNRLLKYDICCEVISPKSYRDEMHELILATLKNYEELWYAIGFRYR